MSAKDYRRKLRQMAPEAFAALSAALQNPRERVAAARVLLERAFPASVLAAIESAEPTRFTFEFNQRGGGRSRPSAEAGRKTSRKESLEATVDTAPDAGSGTTVSDTKEN